MRGESAGKDDKGESRARCGERCGKDDKGERVRGEVRGEVWGEVREDDKGESADSSCFGEAWPQRETGHTLANQCNQIETRKAAGYALQNPWPPMAM